MRRRAVLSKALSVLRIVILESSKMSGRLLADALMRCDDCFEVCCTDDSAEFFAQTEVSNPQVAVISANLQGSHSGGFSVVQQMRNANPNVRIVLLFDSPKRDSVVNAFRMGVSGVFCRAEPIEALAKCIRSVNDAQIWANSRELRFAIEALAQPGLPILVDSRGQSLLSKRESEVAHLAVAGMTNAEVAERMKLSEHTVKNYLRKIFDKLGICNRVELVLYACTQAGLAPWAPTSSPVPVAFSAEDKATFHWHLEMASRGCVAAQFVLAQMYYDGRGIDQDKLSAYAWLLVADQKSKDGGVVNRELRMQLASYLTAEQIKQGKHRADQLSRSISQVQSAPSTQCDELLVSRRQHPSSAA
jgi:DNA-binding NarL/FixJ family response regulator